MTNIMLKLTQIRPGEVHVLVLGQQRTQLCMQRQRIHPQIGRMDAELGDGRNHRVDQHTRRKIGQFGLQREQLGRLCAQVPVGKKERENVGLEIVNH